MFSPNRRQYFYHIVIMEVVLPPFEFVFGLSDLNFGELKVPLDTRLGGDVSSLKATSYTLSMDLKLPSIVMTSKRASCVLKLMC